MKILLTFIAVRPAALKKRRKAVNEVQRQKIFLSERLSASLKILAKQSKL